MANDQKNALIAVALSALILFGWQFYFAPQQAQQAAQTASVPSPHVDTPPPGAPIEDLPNETPLQVQEGDFKINFTNGLAITNMVHPQTHFPFAETVGSDVPVRLEIAPEGQSFRHMSLGTLVGEPNKWVGEDVASGVRVTAYFVRTSMMAIKVSAPKPFKYRLTFTSKEKKLENGQTRYFAYNDGSLHHWGVGDDETADARIHWAGIDFNYHLFAVVFPHEQSLIVRGNSDGTLQLFPSQPVPELNIEVVYAKKEYNYLRSLESNLKSAVDFGIWGFFAEIILRGLQFFYGVMGNWGVSIILLTFVVRLITFPLQYKSFVSMKKMQVVQPELAKLREKYKDDPIRMQKESMDLFKRAGANPLGGCLPLLLQLPVFFAFFKVLNSAVELVDAPFYGWIHDLSNKDPYYVLPLIVTGAMFMQQKLTPQTVTDPVQKKIFMFMPLIFGFIMKDQASGLSLYIFVSTVLGVGQQMLVFHMIKDKPVVV